MINPAEGAALLGAVEANNHRDGRPLDAPNARAVAQATMALKESLPADELEQAWQRGAAMALDDAIALALETD